MKNSSFNGPLFILGYPRSGTKLLRSLLNNHTKIYIPSNETNFIFRIDEKLKEYKNLDTPTFNIFYKWISSSTYFIQKKKENNIITSKNDWYKNIKSWDTKGVFESLLRTDLSLNYNKKSIWGDKSPKYLSNVNKLKFFFPECKIIMIARDVRDCSLSAKKAWGKNILRNSQRWNREMLDFYIQSKDFKSDVHVTRYEDLISNPEHILRQICHFLGINFEEQISKLSKPAENLANLKNTNNIISTNQKKFKNELTEKQIRLINALSYPSLTLYNYSKKRNLRIKVLPKRLNLKFAFLDLLNRFKFDMKREGFFGAQKKMLEHFSFNYL